MATACAILIASAVARLAKRLLPLAAALQLSLLFPEGAPSRLSMLRSTDSKAELSDLLERTRRDGFSPKPAEAVHEILELTRQLDRHDEITRGHSERVRVYTRLIAEELGLDDDELDRLQWVGLLHDIGKLAVPCHILNKPGELDEDEWAAIRLHPEVGARMVEPLRPWLGDVIDGVGQHHERWDGAGYPAGIAGHDISLAARIIAVADVFDVITAQRSYKEAQSPEEALREIARCAGSQFDERVVRALLAIPLRRLRLAVGPLAVLSEIPLLGALGGHVARGVGQMPAIASGTASFGGIAAAAGAVAGLALPVLPSPAAASPSPIPGIESLATESAAAGAVDTLGEPSTSSPRGGPVSTGGRPRTNASGGDEASGDADRYGVVEAEPTPAASGTAGAGGGGAAPATEPAAPAAPDAAPEGGDGSPDLEVRDDMLTSGVHSHVRVTDNDMGVVAETVTVVEPAVHAEKAFFTVTADGGALLHYHAGNGYVGPDQLTYRACDRNGACQTAVVYVVVEGTDSSAPEKGTAGGEPAGGGATPTPPPSGSEPAGGGATPTPPPSSGGGGGGTTGTPATSAGGSAGGPKGGGPKG